MADSNEQERTVWQIPIGATIDPETGEMKLIFREGTRAEFVAAMRPIMEAAKILSRPAANLGIK